MPKGSLCNLHQRRIYFAKGWKSLASLRSLTKALAANSLDLLRQSSKTENSWKKYFPPFFSSSSSENWWTSAFTCHACLSASIVKGEEVCRQSYRSNNAISISVSATRFAKSIIFDFLPKPRNLLPRDWFLLSFEIHFLSSFRWLFVVITGSWYNEEDSGKRRQASLNNFVFSS